MAGESITRKPRIRKGPLTMRQKAEAAQREAGKPKTGPVKKVTSHAKRPFRAAYAKRPFKGSLAKTKSKAPKIPKNRITSFMARILMPFWRLITWFPRYFYGAWRELKLVTWPSRGETWRLTIAVFIFAIVFGGLAYAVDKGLDELFKELVLK